jgi:thioredoxin-like negative regulator of GroEL
MDEKKVPIILDMYAEWCGPCKKLTPILEQLTNDHEGKFKLIKVNIDNLP